MATTARTTPPSKPLSERELLAWRGMLRAHSAVTKALDAELEDGDWFLTHQATGNIHGIAASLGMDPTRMPLNIERVGNTVSASIPILLDEEQRAGRFRPDDLVVLHTAESATWSGAGMALRWR